MESLREYYIRYDNMECGEFIKTRHIVEDGAGTHFIAIHHFHDITIRGEFIRTDELFSSKDELWKEMREISRQRALSGLPILGFHTMENMLDYYRDQMRRYQLKIKIWGHLGLGIISNILTLHCNETGGFLSGEWIYPGDWDFYRVAAAPAFKNAASYED